MIILIIFRKKSPAVELNPKNINLFLFFKLPSAFLCGVRARQVDRWACVVTVRHRWINQNPFKSMYFAVQAMAAELSTGVLVMREIKNCGKDISMLVTGGKSVFHKKATGKITFTCRDGQIVSDMVSSAILSSEKQVMVLKSVGTDESGDQVCEMEFEWNIKMR